MTLNWPLIQLSNHFQADLFAGALFITEATKLDGDYAIYIAILILLVTWDIP